MMQEEREGGFRVEGKRERALSNLKHAASPPAKWL
jgi:hypothetical protein